jgi:hypothetical protein
MPGVHAGSDQYRQRREGELRVGDDHPARGPARLLGELGAAEDDRGLRALKVGEIAASDKKREVARAGAIERGNAVDGDICRSDEPPACKSGELARRDTPSALGGHGATLTGPFADAP